MPDRVDLFDSTYGHFKDNVLAEIRKETYGEDIGQTSWITANEYDTFYIWLNLKPGAHVLEVASGSGGPALYLARKYGCRITGIDINDEGLATAKRAARDANISGVEFQFVDVNEGLPFWDDTFDAVMCIDSANHFGNRFAVLKEWYRVLKPGQRILFTDPVVITGPISNDEIAARSNIGFFIFMPLETTEKFIKEAGFTLVRKEDVTRSIELTSGRWHDARQKRRDDLIRFEGEERFEGLQRFFTAVHKLTSERRLSRFVFVAEK